MAQSTEEYFRELASILEVDRDEEDDREQVDSFHPAVCRQLGLDPTSTFVQDMWAGIGESSTRTKPRVMANGAVFDANTLADTAEEIEAALARRSIPLPSVPYFGIFRTGHVNGRVILAPNGIDHVIALHRGTFRIFHRCASLLAYILPEVDATGGLNFASGWTDDELRTMWQEHLKTKPEAVEHFAFTMLSYILDERIVRRELKWHDPALTFDSPGRFHIESNLAAGMRLFLVGHEYGHIVSGHLTVGAIARRATTREGANILLLSPAWDQEFEADSLGANVAVGAMLHAIRQLEWTIAAVDNFFTVMTILETNSEFARALHVFRLQYRDTGWSDTHPPLMDRRDRVIACCMSTFGEDLTASLELCRFFRWGMICVAEAARPQLTPILQDLFLASLGPDWAEKLRHFEEASGAIADENPRS